MSLVEVDSYTPSGPSPSMPTSSGSNAPPRRSVAFAAAGADDRRTGQTAAAVGIDTLISLDGAKHRRVPGHRCQLVQAECAGGQVNALAKGFVDKLAAAGGGCDFVQTVGSTIRCNNDHVAARHPRGRFRVHAQKLAQGTRRQRRPGSQRSTSDEENMMAMLDMFAYFKLTEPPGRPTDDLASRRSPTPPSTAPARHPDALVLRDRPGEADTTSSSISGGLQALIRTSRSARQAARQPGPDAAGGGDDPLGPTPSRSSCGPPSGHRTARQDDQKRRRGICCRTCQPNRDDEGVRRPVRPSISSVNPTKSAFGRGLHFLSRRAAGRMGSGRSSELLAPGPHRVGG